jgi:hypothetical protein
MLEALSMGAHGLVAWCGLSVLVGTLWMVARTDAARRGQGIVLGATGALAVGVALIAWGVRCT